MNYSSHTESPLESPAIKAPPLVHREEKLELTIDTKSQISSARYIKNQEKQPFEIIKQSPNQQHYTCFTPPVNPSPLPSPTTNVGSSAHSTPIDFDYNQLKSREGMLRYYELMRRLYSGPSPALAPPSPIDGEILQSLRFPTPKPLEENSNISNSDETEKCLKNLQLSTDFKPIPSMIHPKPPNPNYYPTQHQSCAINLSKNFLFSPNVREKALHHSCKAQLKAPPTLPPLDLEKLKPITSTYLQLTRSMGLSDADALRFDDLVSADFEFSF